MSSNTITFWNYIKNNVVEIPIIQRDYAQGRLGKEHIRKTFLTSIKEALDNKTTLKLDFVYGSTENGKLNPLDGQQRLTTLWLMHWYIALHAGKLNSDNSSIFKHFTYETRISSREFCEKLCDYQCFQEFENNNIVQFITNQTWFYSAWKQDPTIQSMLRMLGGTKIVDKSGEDILDGIEELFIETSSEDFKNYWKILTEEEAIVFYNLPLQDFGLSDDLYIKMNARGKPLTSFENFKADLIGYITEQSEDESLDEETRNMWKALLDPVSGIPLLLDTDWTELFWKNKSKGKKILNENKEIKFVKENQIDEIFFGFLNRFFWNELFITKKTESPKENVLDIGKGDEGSNQEYNNISYSYLVGSSSNKRKASDSDIQIAYKGLNVYEYYNGIPMNLFYKLQRVLNNYSKLQIIPDCSWDTTFRFIPQYIEDKESNIEIVNNANEKILQITSISQIQRIVFFALCKYFDHDTSVNDDITSLKRWMRVVRNLISSEDHTGRPQIRSTQVMRTAIEFIDELDSHNVYNSLYNYDIQKLSNSDFEKRCKEEIIKSKQILDENGNIRKYNGSCKKENGQVFETWEEIITAAENHDFYKGAIRFLYIDDSNTINWSYFDNKWENLKVLIPSNQENRHTIKLLLPYLSDNDLKDIFSTRDFSNNNNNLRLLLTDFSSKVHNFLLQNDKNKNESLLHVDMNILCEKCPNYLIHIAWEEGFDVLSNYSYKSGYYKDYSYVVGNTFLIERLSLLKKTSGVIIKEPTYEEKDDNNHSIWKGLFIDFAYNNKHFRWELNNHIEIYDEKWNNKQGSGFHFDGDDSKSLLEELNKITCVIAG